MAGTELSPGLLETYMCRFELPKEQILEQKKCFDVLDEDHSGKITLEKLRIENKKYKWGMSEKELAEQFQELDVDGNGGISFWEFLKVYVKGTFGREVHIGLEHEETNIKDVIPLTMRARSRSITSILMPIDEEAPGHMVMKLSRQNSIAFYVRSASLFLKGTEGKDGAEKKEPVEVLKLRALGEAVGTAISVATRVEKDGLGKIVKVRTSFPTMPNGRGCAQISVDVQRVAPAADAVEVPPP